MQVESLRKEVTKLKTEKAALTVKSKLFENFAVMAHSCCRRPSSAEWQSVKDTLQKTLEFSAENRGRKQQSGFTRQQWRRLRQYPEAWRYRRGSVQLFNRPGFK
jgi:hypothetical protein